ncbi:HNH endonuclease signature motif containing protein [Anaerospora sp.]|uniref:HNH endonuclease n=1 Tax=Anaerospora sp. TaxID=1960278 RepID=UPI00289D60A7|nr:HNH endonuclease signature motif containing protein [Anaerospora sp.]
MKIEIILSKKEDKYCNSVDTFNNLFLINADINIHKTNGTFMYNKSEVQYLCTTEVINNGSERLFYIKLDSGEKNEEESLDNLREISRIIRHQIKELNIEFVENVIWDEVSQHYCRQGYPIINEIENLMRKLIYLFIIRNVGSTWLNKSSPEEFKNKLQNNIQRNKVQKIEENILYEADFIQLSQLLFTPYSTISINDFYNKIEKDSDIEKIREYLPKSNWQRYFKSHIPYDKLDEDWGKLYTLRNKIAHNKLVNKGDWGILQNLSHKIRNILLEAISKVQTIIVPKDEIKHVVSLVENTVRGRRFILKTVKKYLELGNPERRCFICDEFIEGVSTVDHIIPRRVIGEEGNSLWNLAEVHQQCNFLKAGNMPSEELIDKLIIRNENLIKILEAEGISDEEFVDFKEFVSSGGVQRVWDQHRGLVNN